VGWFVDWLVGGWVEWLVDWLVGWFVVGWVGWLIDWLIDVLTD
jgi:hypothetical protein